MAVCQAGAAADEGSEITTEEGASGDVPDQRKDHSRGKKGEGRERAA